MPLNPSGPGHQAVVNLSHRSEAKAIAGLICGVMALPASLYIPILGLALGVLGLALSTISLSEHKRKLPIIGIVFSSLAIVAALGIFVYNLEKAQKSQDAAGSSSTAAAVIGSPSALVTIKTPCFSVKIPGGLNNYTPTGCGFDSEGVGNEYTVGALNNPGIAASNFKAAADKLIASGASDAKASIISESQTSFVGSPAISAIMQVSDTSAYMVIDAVLHTTTKDNVFLVIRSENNDPRPTLGTLSSTWQWGA